MTEPAQKRSSVIDLSPVPLISIGVVIFILTLVRTWVRILVRREFGPRQEVVGESGNGATGTTTSGSSFPSRPSIATGPDAAIKAKAYTVFTDRAYDTAACRLKCFKDHAGECEAFRVFTDGGACYIYRRDEALNEPKLISPIRTYSKCDCSTYEKSESGQCTARARYDNDACAMKCCAMPSQQAAYLLPGEILEFNQRLSTGSSQYKLLFNERKQLALIEWETTLLKKLGGYHSGGSYLTLTGAGEVQVRDRSGDLMWSNYSSKLSDADLRKTFRRRGVVLQSPSLRLSAAGRLEVWGSRNGGAQRPYWRLDRSAYKLI